MEGASSSGNGGVPAAPQRTSCIGGLLASTSRTLPKTSIWFPFSAIVASSQPRNAPSERRQVAGDRSTRSGRIQALVMKLQSLEARAARMRSESALKPQGPGLLALSAFRPTSNTTSIPSAASTTERGKGAPAPCTPCRHHRLHPRDRNMPIYSHRTAASIHPARAHGVPHRQHAPSPLGTHSSSAAAGTNAQMWDVEDDAARRTQAGAAEVGRIESGSGGGRLGESDSESQWYRDVPSRSLKSESCECGTTGLVAAGTVCWCAASDPRVKAVGGLDSLSQNRGPSRSRESREQAYVRRGAGGDDTERCSGVRRTFKPRGIFYYNEYPGEGCLAWSEAGRRCSKSILLMELRKARCVEILHIQKEDGEQNLFWILADSDLPPPLNWVNLAAESVDIDRSTTAIYPRNGSPSVWM
ncbi:hypothetical protein C8J57DRAFT_1235367 [Mycena rebaudengoi]|nr:hypothetical protein C8J57DRAFT_1235367 [Mycena rebaudengoi]